MNRLTQILILLSSKWWTVLLVVALNFASFAMLFSVDDAFEAITKVPVYDTQNDLTPGLILEQLPLYQGEALTVYYRFAAVDFVFPFAGSLFFAVLWTLLLRLNTWSIAQRLLMWNFPLVVFLVTVIDWCENIAILVLLSGSPTTAMIDAVLTFKRLKLIGLAISGWGTMLILLFLIANLLNRVLRARRIGSQTA